MGKLIDKRFGRDWTEVLERWAQGGPVRVSPEQGWAALEALERLRPNYLAHAYEDSTPSNAVLSHILADGVDLLACEDLLGIHAVIARLDQEEPGAVAELRILAFCSRIGLVPIVEPEVRGKRPDFAIDTAEQRVFFEVIRPAFADAGLELHELLGIAANRLFESLQPGQRMQVAFIQEPTEELIGQVEKAVASMAEGPELVKVGEVALVQLRDARDETEGLQSESGPALGQAKFAIRDGVATVVNVTAPFSDERAQRLVSRELHHFAKGEPNVLAIDVTAIPGGLRMWPTLIRRTFQPTRNTRIGAVVLYELAYDGVVVPGDLNGCVLVNPHAKTPVDPHLLDRIAAALAEPVR